MTPYEVFKLLWPIVGLMNEIARAFDHHLTQLALVGLRVKVSECKLWNPSGLFLGI